MIVLSAPLAFPTARMCQAAIGFADEECPVNGTVPSALPTATTWLPRKAAVGVKASSVGVTTP